jgi:hypothetical protein
MRFNLLIGVLRLEPALIAKVARRDGRFISCVVVGEERCAFLRPLCLQANVQSANRCTRLKGASRRIAVGEILPSIARLARGLNVKHHLMLTDYVYYEPQPTVSALNNSP